MLTANLARLYNKLCKKNSVKHFPNNTLNFKFTETENNKNLYYNRRERERERITINGFHYKAIPVNNFTRYRAHTFFQQHSGILNKEPKCHLAAYSVYCFNKMEKKFLFLTKKNLNKKYIIKPGQF